MLIDIDKNIELPHYELVLCKPNGNELCELYNITNFVFKRRFVDMDEITFNVPFYIMDNHKKIKNPNFDDIEGDYLILVNDSQYFIIDDIKKLYDDEGHEYKEVHCYSLEWELLHKEIRGYKANSRKLHTFANEIDEDGYYIGIMNYIETLTAWKVGYVNQDLLIKYRSFDISKQNLIQAFQDIQRTFNCVFQYNTLERKINIYKIEDLGQDKGFFISDDNYIKSLTENIKHKEIKTRLYLYGKDNISINAINPTGQPFIQNFSFYKTLKYMDQDLINALNNYDALVSSKQTDFNNYLQQLENLKSTLGTKQDELDVLEAELRVIEIEIDAIIAAGGDLTEKNQEKANKEAQISIKEAEIASLNSQINNINGNIVTLRNLLKMENNFTVDQLTRLDYFVRYDSYEDSNYTEENIRELYDEGATMLSKVSQPPIEFEIEVVDFLNLIEEQHNWGKLVLGDIVNIHHSNFGVDIQVRLIGYTHDVEENQLSLEFSNRNALDDPNLYLKDLLASIATTSSQVDYSRFKWGAYEDSGERTSILDFIENEFDLTKNRIVKAKGQSPIMDERGIWLLKQNNDGTVDPEQIRMINNIIAYTPDNWETVKAAFGKVGDNYGLLGEAILGKLGVFCTVRADQIIVGDEGQTISDDVLGGSIVKQDTLYNFVKITQNDGIQVFDNNGLERMKMGNYAPNKYGILIKSKTGNRTILDEDGILTSFQQSMTDNMDQGTSAILKIHIPSNANGIIETKLALSLEQFRSYVKTVKLVQNVGTVYDYQADKSTNSAGSHNHTLSSVFVSGSASSDGLHNHSVSGSSTGYSGTHSHNISISGSTQSDGSHSHTINLNHSHGININHNHDLEYGVYQGSAPTNLRIFINGVDRTSALGGTRSGVMTTPELNITPYITSNGWHTIEFTSDTVGRIVAHVTGMYYMLAPN